ncbi:MAG: ATP-binding protein [Tannerella sp.]|jgi:predicted kinase|nr:ATP-binding protein [Tannerella sp.]
MKHPVIWKPERLWTETDHPVLYIFSGLPGTGKTTLARNLSSILKAVYLRMDTIEQGIMDLCKFNVQGEGYRLAYKIIEDNLKTGNSIISDQCNPWKLTRNEFKNTAIENNCAYVNIEIICSNREEHKRRIENRKFPPWEAINKWNYESWDEEHIIIDTANRTIEACTKELIEKLNTET